MITKFISAIIILAAVSGVSEAAGKRDVNEVISALQERLARNIRSGCVTYNQYGVRYCNKERHVSFSDGELIYFERSDYLLDGRKCCKYSPLTNRIPVKQVGAVANEYIDGLKGEPKSYLVTLKCISDGCVKSHMRAGEKQNISGEQELHEDQNSLVFMFFNDKQSATAVEGLIKELLVLCKDQDPCRATGAQN